MQIPNIGFFQHIAHALPDIFIGLSLVTLFIIKMIFKEEQARKIAPKFSIVACFCGFLLSIVYSSMGNVFFAKLFTYDDFSHNSKIILLFAAFIWMFIMSSIKRYKNISSLFYILTFGVITSIMICLSSNNFLLLLLGLEGYTISVCFLLMIKPFNADSRLNAIRFFISSIIMTAIFFYGISLLYNNSGSFLFADIKQDGNLSSTIGLLLILSALLFKLAAAPFHSWAVDIYEKAPMSIILFFETISKLFMILLLTKICIALVNKGVECHEIFFQIVAILSMAIGCIMPLIQKNIKKFIAYVSIGHIGFAMTVFATAKDISYFRFPATYAISYIIPFICFIASIKALRGSRKIETFSDIQGIAYEFPLIAYSITISLIAMAGFPPFISFIAKLNIFKMLIINSNWTLLIISCLYTLISIIYITKCSRYAFIKKQRNFENKETPAKNSAVVVTLILLVLSSIAFPAIDTLFSKIVSEVK